MIKQKIKILDKLKECGYSTYRIRKEHILSENIVQKLRKEDEAMYLNLETVNRICNITQLDIGDLFIYIKD